MANLFDAPGKIAVTKRAIHIRRAPPPTAPRWRQSELLIAVNERKLMLPGDPKQVPLVFDLQVS